MAEMALTDRRFDEAEQMFQGLLRSIEGAQLDGARELEALVLSDLCVALAAQDRAVEAVELGERARSLVDSEPLEAMAELRVRRANALVRWCIGHVQQVDMLAPFARKKWRSEELSRVLRLVELGRVKSAIEGAHHLHEPIVLADLAVLIGDVEAAYRSLENGWHWDGSSAFIKESYFDRLRGHALKALIELARGDVARAAHLLSSMHEMAREPEPDQDPEGAPRAEAMRAYVSAILAAETGEPHGAQTSLQRARAFIDEWGRYGLDRRSRLRALLTVDLGLTMLEPSPEQGLAMARDLPGKAVALLGDTAEDQLSRVIAVKAYAELARRLPAGEDKDAATHRALDLAQPLAGLGVPAWDELLQPTG